MTDTVISVSNVSKCYRVFDAQRSRLLHAVWPAHTKGMREVWALKDISFEVKRGESMAIIGRNGGGKSTLLEILTGTLTPTSGSVKVNGRVSALLELGSGFNPEYTGRENVFLNGLLLGLSRTEVEHRFDDIVSFADIGDVLERQVKTYSSGMLVRLAFAVQIALEPDILIVDEALSVGDYFFQQKCFGRLRKMREEGLTLLFVSHDMGTVRDLCTSAVYLRHGKSMFIGDSKIAIRHYFAESDNSSPTPHARQGILPKSSAPLVPTIDELPADAIWHSAVCKNIGILAVRALDAHGRPVSGVRMGETLKIEIYFLNPDDELATISLSFKNRYDQIVFCTNSSLLKIVHCRTDQRVGVLTFEFEMNLEAALYSLRVALNVPCGDNRGKEYDSTDWIGPLQTLWDYENETAPFLGLFGLPATARLAYKNKEGL